MVLFNVGGFLWGVLQLHGHFLQLLVQLLNKGGGEKKIHLYFIVLEMGLTDAETTKFKVTRHIFPSMQSDQWTTTCCTCLLLQCKRVSSVRDMITLLVLQESRRSSSFATVVNKSEDKCSYSSLRDAEKAEKTATGLWDVTQWQRTAGKRF